MDFKHRCDGKELPQVVDPKYSKAVHMQSFRNSLLTGHGRQRHITATDRDPQTHADKECVKGPIYMLHYFAFPRV